MKAALIALALVVVPIAKAAPVEGYKDVKWGTSIQEFKTKLPCKLGWAKAYWPPAPMEVYVCPDLSFIHYEVVATAYFISGKFEAFEMELGGIEITDDLKKKYPDHTLPTVNELLSFRNREISTISAYFASRTIQLKASDKGYTLIYRSVGFENRAKTILSNNSMKDL